MRCCTIHNTNLQLFLSRWRMSSPWGNHWTQQILEHRAHLHLSRIVWKSLILSVSSRRLKNQLQSKRWECPTFFCHSFMVYFKFEILLTNLKQCIEIRQIFQNESISPLPSGSSSTRVQSPTPAPLLNELSQSRTQPGSLALEVCLFTSLVTMFDVCDENEIYLTFPGQHI